MTVKKFNYEELKKASIDFSTSRILGKGSHGCIYKGVLENGQLVAIKRCSSGLQNLQDNSKLENEVDILSSLPKTHHIVGLLGTSVGELQNNKQDVILVMEFMSNGSLYDLLHASPQQAMSLSWAKRAHIALQLAKGLQFLHNLTPTLIHRDIKSDNVLLDENWNLKIADFGLAVRLNDEDSSSQVRVVNSSVSRPAGTIGYLDPCYVDPCMLSTKIDIFSFGVVVLEIISGQKVIDVSRSTTSLVEWALPLIKQRKFGQIFDQRVPLPAFIQGAMRHLLDISARCVSTNAEQRPTINQIVNEMENCYVERVRFPFWVKFVRGFVNKETSNKRAISTIKCVACPGDIHKQNNSVSQGKLLLRDVLATNEVFI